MVTVIEQAVSPRTIRKRILKVKEAEIDSRGLDEVSPRTIRKRILKDKPGCIIRKIFSLFHPARSVRGY